MVKQHVKIDRICSISKECKNCRGRHWNPNSQQKTQASARAEFGYTPNKCVNGDGGIIHCPAALGLI